MASGGSSLVDDKYDRFGDVVAYPLKLKEALNKVVAKIPDQWENVGHFLEISDDKIQSFKCDIHNNGEPRNFFKSVLVEWEKSKTVPYNWATLLKCISSDAIGNVTLANEIAKDLASSERVLTAENALQLLKSCEFRIVSNWSKLSSTLGVPLEDRKRLRMQAMLHSNYEDGLEECLQIWIKNSHDKATWDQLFTAVEREERVTAKRMRDKYEEWM